MTDYYVNSTAVVEDGAVIGKGTSIWHFSHVMPKAIIGKDCNIGQSVFVDNNATIGDFCKIQNNVNVYEGVTLEDYVFCGPSMTFTNVKIPRCKFPRKREGEYYHKTLVKEGASIGAHAVIVCGIKIGRNALIGSGSVVTKDIPDYALVIGNPARQIGWVCECGNRLVGNIKYKCFCCDKEYIEVEGYLIEE